MKVSITRGVRSFFSVQPPCALCLCGEKDAANTHHKDTERTEVAQRTPHLLVAVRELNCVHEILTIKNLTHQR